MKWKECLREPDMDIQDKIKLIVLAGPTAVGKTEFAIEIAKRLDGEIVNCDSMQIYKHMDIGSAKPTPAERSEVPHHLVDFVSPSEEFSVAKYQKYARECIIDISQRGKLPILSGGTGLYIDSVIYDMDFSNKPEGGIFNKRREELYRIAEEEGNEALHYKLAELSSKRAGEIHPNNIKKVVRAIEILESGENPGDFESLKKRKYKDFDAKLFCLNRDREELYDRINRRVDILMKQGLESEIRDLLDMGISSDDISMKGIGYKEMLSYINGECNLDTAVELIKRNSRRFAKRQLTWFRKYDDMTWINLNHKSFEEAIEIVRGSYGK